jgi:hypothetical protein
MRAGQSVFLEDSIWVQRSLLPLSFIGKGIVVSVVLLLGFASIVRGSESSNPPDEQKTLKQLTLSQLGNVEVTTAAKTTEQVWKTSAAIFVLTQDDIPAVGCDDNSGRVTSGTGSGSCTH